MTRWLSLSLFAIAALCAAPYNASSQPPPPVKPQIVSITPSGVNTVTQSSGAHGLNVAVGAWSGGFLVPEPTGMTSVRILINVNDGGNLVFSNWLQSYDTAEYDRADVYLETPSRKIYFARGVGRGTPWQPPCCIYFSTPQAPHDISLDPWKNQQVTLVVDLHNDGFGDQTQMNLVNVEFSACAVPWPAELTSPEALDFENGNTLNLDGLTEGTRTALTCLQTAVRAEGGTFEMSGTTFTSAYRNSEYQAHLQEIWRLKRQVDQEKGNACDALKTHLNQEIAKHDMENLKLSPAGRSGPHTVGDAMDIRLGSTGITVDRLVQLAQGCNMVRPFARRDPVHFVHRPPQ
jgi:hypothetical protein